MLFMLLFLGWTAAVTALGSEHDDETGLRLSCTNDGDKTMNCQMDAQNCTGLNLTMQVNVKHRIITNSCIPILCSIGHCCCSIEMDIVLGEEPNATVWGEGQKMGTKVIKVNDTIKPKSPTVVAVEEVNGKIQIKWKPNMKDNIDLNFTVMYRKKGDTEEVPTTVNAPSGVTSNGLKTCEIPRGDLEPNTEYLFTVKSHRNNLSSENSNEMEFKTAPTPNNNMLILVIVVLSVAAVVISSLIFGCFTKMKTKWDSGARWPDSKLLDLQTSEEWLLKPELLIISVVNVVPIYADDIKSCYTLCGSVIDSSSGEYQESSRMGSGSYSLGYAKAEPADVVACVHEALAKLLPNVGNSKPLCFDNLSYTYLHPGFPPPVVTDIPECQVQTRLLCDSGYHPSEPEDVVTAADQRLLFNFPPMLPSSVSVDMSYQQCGTDSGVSSLSYSSSNNANVEADSFTEGLKQHGKSLEGTVGDGSFLLGCLNQGTKSFTPVIDDYQCV